MSEQLPARPWSDDVVKEFLTATARQTSDPEKFYKTHLDIDRIYAESLIGRFHDELVTQAEFRDAILESDLEDPIRTFILRGETGSGKSQLCQWLEYEIAGEGRGLGSESHIPLHIKANETNLEQIISTLAEPLGIDPGIDQVTELDAEKVADAIISNLEANPGGALKEVNLEEITRESGGDLESILVENIRDYQQSVDSDDIEEFDPNLLSNDDFRDMALKMGTESVFHQERETLRHTLRDEIHRHFSHVVGVEDFQGQLREYAQLYIDDLGRRPVIICEDVTTFSVLKEQLLDQIIQVESASYDLVLGYTTGFEQDDLEDALAGRESGDALTYLKDRAEGYLSLTEDGEALFIDDSLAVDLVRKYLDVIKVESATERDEDLEQAFDGLYPFNRPLVMQAWDNLIEDGAPRKTPRVLLQKVVRSCLLSEGPPHQTLTRNPNVDELVPKIAVERYDDPELRSLTTWYGVHDGEFVIVPSRILETFGYDPDAVGKAARVDDGVEFTEFEPDEFARADPPRYLDPDEAEDFEDPTELSSSEADTGDPSSTHTPPVGGTESSDSGDSSESDDGDARSNWNELVQWVETGEKYPSSNRLRDGAVDLLEMWFDPTRIANPNAPTTGMTGIYYTRGGDVPVSVQGVDERDDLSVMLEFGMEHMDLYRSIYSLNEDGEIPEGANAQLLRNWATDATAELRNDIRAELEGCLPPGMTLEHAIVFGKYLVTNLHFGIESLDRDVVFTDTTDGRGYDHPFVTHLKRQEPLFEAMDQLQARRSDIDALIEGFFLLKKNLVDHQRLNPIQRDVAEDPGHYLELAQQIDTTELDYPGAYGIGTTRSNAGSGPDVTALFEAISDYAVEVELLTDDDLSEWMGDHTDAVGRWFDPSVTVDELTETYERLRDALGVFDISEKARWEDSYNALQDPETQTDLEGFAREVDDFLDPSTATPFERLNLLHTFQQSYDEHLAWAVYRSIDEMIVHLDAKDVSDDTNARERIRELDEFQNLLDRQSTIHASLEGSTNV